MISATSPAYLIAGLAAVMALAASGLTLFVDRVLRGPAVMNGSARGTALVVLVVAVPILVGSMFGVARGGTWPVISWLGAGAYLLYNSILFLFMTPFNQLFLLYVAMFAFSFWTLVTLLSAINVQGFGTRYTPAFPVRAIAAYIAVIAALNGLAWLVKVIPAVMSTSSPSYLNGTGLPTNPVYVRTSPFGFP